MRADAMIIVATVDEIEGKAREVFDPLFNGRRYYVDCPHIVPTTMPSSGPVTRWQAHVSAEEGLA